MLLLSPIILAQEQEELLIMGGTLADGLVLPGPVSTDTNGNIYIFNEGTNELLSLTSRMDFRLRFGGYGEGEGSLESPAHLIVSKGRLIISDVGCLKIFDQKGNFKKKIEKIGEEKLVRPMGLSTDLRNRLYIADPGLGKVIICESDFKPYKVIDEIIKEPIHCFLTSTSRYVILDRALKKAFLLSSYFAKIKEFGDFKNPLSISTDGTRRIYVLDDSTIHVFSIGGDQRFKWRLAPKTPGGVYPAIAISDGNLLVTSRNTNELIKIDTDDGKIKTIIEHDSSTLCLPSGHEIDENGRVYICDSIHNKVRVVSQVGQHLFEILIKNPGRIAVSQYLFAVVHAEDNKVSVFTREGGSLYSIEVDNPVDCDFTGDESLLILTGDGNVTKYSGSEKIGDVVDDDDKVDSPVSIDYYNDYFAVASLHNSISVFTRLGEYSWSIKTEKSPRDVILLSPQRLIAVFDDRMVLLDQAGDEMSKFGSSGGPFSIGVKLKSTIEYDKNLEKFTNPVSISRFGDWLYVLDKIAMRLIRFNKSVLLTPPKIKVSPAILNFGHIPADSEAEEEIVIQNVGGETLEGSFSVVPKWLTVSSKKFKGDDVVIKVRAKTLHFISSMKYCENIILDSNAGKVVIPCILEVPNLAVNQIDVRIQIGNKIAMIGDKKIDLGVAPFIMNGKTMVPLRFISEAFGGSLEVDGEYIDISFPKKDMWVSIQVGDKNVVLSVGEESSFTKINPPPILKSGSTFVPLTFFTDILECESIWDPNNKSIRLVYILD